MKVGTVGRVDPIQGKLRHPIQGCQVVRDASRVLPDPGRVAHPQDEIPGEEGRPLRPVEAEVVFAVAGSPHRHQGAFVRGHLGSLLQGTGGGVTGPEHPGPG